VRSFLTLIFRGHFASFQEQDYPAHITALLRTELLRMRQETGITSIMQTVALSDAVNTYLV